ncbi:MAG: hypothetical protein Q8Q35_04610 [Nanoarchaeota archaeon]|nr:hypothetical protein [Nanoarchaeota archaeon]
MTSKNPLEDMLLESVPSLAHDVVDRMNILFEGVNVLPDDDLASAMRYFGLLNNNDLTSEGYKLYHKLLNLGYFEKLKLDKSDNPLDKILNLGDLDHLFSKPGITRLFNLVREERNKQKTVPITLGDFYNFYKNNIPEEGRRRFREGLGKVVFNGLDRFVREKELESVPYFFRQLPLIDHIDNVYPVELGRMELSPEKVGDYVFAGGIEVIDTNSSNLLYWKAMNDRSWFKSYYVSGDLLRININDVFHYWNLRDNQSKMFVDKAVKNIKSKVK